MKNKNLSNQKRMAKFQSNLRSRASIVSNGLIKSNPVFKLVLGMCPTLAVTTSVKNGLGMGMAVTFVLLCSNILVSLLRKIIPDKVRIPAFVVIIATFVTVVQMVMRRFIPSLYASLGIFLPLIVVNCVILARAEAFASSHPVAESALDGLGMGLGFTAALGLIGMVREIIGAGTFFDLPIGNLPNAGAMSIFVLPAGGFLALGLLMAIVNAISNKIEKLKEIRKSPNRDEIIKANRKKRIDGIAINNPKIAVLVAKSYEIKDAKKALKAKENTDINAKEVK